jgi:hypothetical protein
MFIPLLVVACAPAPVGGASPSSGTAPAPAGIAPQPTGTTGTTGTQPLGTWDGPLASIEPTTTFVNGAATITDTQFAVADFDGDGLDDYALDTSLGVEVWFGPLPAGEVEVGTGPVHVSRAFPDAPEPRMIAGAGDVDGDGRAELFLGWRALAVPRSGEVVDLDAATVLTVLPALDDAQVADVDGDGHADLISDYTDSWISIAYGPFTAGSTVQLPALYESTPAADQAMIRSPSTTCPFATNAWILPDLDADGTLELLATTVTWQSYTLDGDCAGLDPNALFDLGNLRGQELEMADARVIGVSSELTPLSDTNGDGLGDFVTRSSLYQGADVLAAGSAAVPRATVAGVPDEAFAMTRWIDVSGDGVAEVLLGAVGQPGLRVMDGMLAQGPVDPWRAGYGIDAEAAGASHIADLTGDGTPDILLANSDLTWVFSGAMLAGLWADETP